MGRTGRPDAHFNPRTPCGVRPYSKYEVGTSSPFQSTHPVRGATACVHPAEPCIQFQSTHPVRGATPKWTREESQKIFQSTHPVRGATRCAYDLHAQRVISIHAPRAGCDRALRQQREMTQAISIHAPRAGCDKRLGVGIDGVPISIHAPRAGCDAGQSPRVFSLAYFNPRTPCGVRPHAPALPRSSRRHFNPRTPCGVRRQI